MFFTFLFFSILSFSSAVPLTPTSSVTPNIIFGPSNTPTRSQTPNAPWYSPSVSPSLFCYAGTATELLQLYSLQTNSWLTVGDFSQFVWTLQSLNYFNSQDRIRGIALYKALTLKFTSPYDITPFQLPDFPSQTRFAYDNAFITIRACVWPSIITGLISALSIPSLPFNYTQQWASYYYGNLTLAVTSLADGACTYDQLTFELNPPTPTGLPIFWVLFDPELGCQIPVTKSWVKPLHFGIPCHRNLLTYNSLLSLAKSSCRFVYTPGNCTDSCCCVYQYTCIQPMNNIICSPGDDACCISNGAQCPGGGFSVSQTTCLASYGSDSTSPTASVTPSVTPTISPSGTVSQTISVSPTISTTNTRTPTPTLSTSGTPSASPVSKSPTTTPSITQSRTRTNSFSNSVGATQSNTPTNSVLSKSPTSSMSISESSTSSETASPTHTPSNSATASNFAGPCTSTCCCGRISGGPCYQPLAQNQCNPSASACYASCPSPFVCLFNNACTTGVSNSATSSVTTSPSASAVWFNGTLQSLTEA